MEILNELISTYKDYPKEGIDFKDVLKITQHPIVFKELILKMASSDIVANAEALISIDARGFIFGSAISFQVSKPIVLIIDFVCSHSSWRPPCAPTSRKFILKFGSNFFIELIMSFIMARSFLNFSILISIYIKISTFVHYLSI